MNHIERSTARRIVVLAVAALATLACGDTITVRPDVPEACAQPLACRVSGVDLVVDAPRLLEPTNPQLDSLTGRPVFDPGDSLTVETRVWNRGDEASEAASYRLYSVIGYSSTSQDFGVPALAPGEAWLDTLVTALPADVHMASDTIAVGVVELEAQDDPVYDNDRAQLDGFVRLGIIRVDIELPDTAPVVQVRTRTGDFTRLRVDHAFPMTVTVRNESRFGTLPARDLWFCGWDYDFGCGARVGAPFFGMEVPAIGPGEEWTTTADVSIPGVGYYADETFLWSLSACFAAPGAVVEYFGDFTCRPSNVLVETIPNYEVTCTVPLLAPDTTVTNLDGFDCDWYYQVWGVDVAAGDTVAIETTGFVELHDADGGEPPGVWTEGGRTLVSPLETARYYLAGQGNYSITLTAVAR